MGQVGPEGWRNPFRSETSAENANTCRVFSLADRKGNGVNIPQPDTEIGPSGPSAVNATDSETSDGGPGKSYLLFVRVRCPWNRLVRENRDACSE
ncbi:hypothetical protein JTE90_017468 [Oedothorax gibbosus]|uniref:Uncharacterized protein n=1 Tax=Oedothorax gibbosus TaxID=931172 RepID=A0AAV6TF61_9ARAC|nr:hypothetical protein JTE90_017468 [Oedothorax gibbosus]